MSSNFLGIPPEIRDVIIEDVILSERLPPSNPAEAAPTHQNHISASFKDKDGKPSERFLTWFGSGFVHFEGASQYNTNAIALRLVNIQLNDEVSLAIARLGEQRTRRYKLDVLFFNEHELYPTWLSVPVLTDQVEQVDATFRIFGNKLCYPKQRPPYVALGDGGPPQMVWCFYYLMESFLRRGPILSMTSEDRKVIIKVLNLNFVAGDSGAETYEEDERMLWWRTFHSFRPPELEGKRVMRPEFLADWLTGYLRGLLSMGYHHARCGSILHKRIGTIQIFVEGELVQRVEPAQILSRLSYTDPRNTFGHIFNHDERIPKFLAWKEKAERRRRERGLPVIISQGDVKVTV